MRIPWKPKNWCVYIFWLFSSLATFSCVNLKTVGDFSTASVAGIQNFEQIDYTFLDHCLDRCKDEAISKIEFRRTLECSCEVYAEADSVTQLFYRTIGGYFLGLEDLSQNELTDYSTDAVVNSLTATEMGPLKIDENLAVAYTSLSNTLLRATTDFYRRRKLSAYIEEANAPLQTLLGSWQKIIRTNLKGELRFKKERMYSYYMDVKMSGALKTDYDGRRATAEYYQALDEIQQLEKQMDLFAEGLAEIAAGHQVLYDNRDKLSVKDIAIDMLGYSAEVKTLVSEFNKLNQ